MSTDRVPIRDAVLTMAYFAERDGLQESARLLYAVGGMMPSDPRLDASVEIAGEKTEDAFFRVIAQYAQRGMKIANKTGLGIGGN
jgi:hypothetical protein